MKPGLGTIVICVAAICVLVVTSPSTSAQAVNATLLGTVTDSSGAVVASAKVTITEVNGQSGLANNLEFEGLDDNERTGLLSIYIPPIESVQTVDVTTSNYDAELGRANGAVTNVILKSGS